MDQSSDEARIRELVQRLKLADGQRAPGFEELLVRAERKPDRGPVRRRQLAAVCCTVATLVGAFLFLPWRPRYDDPVVESERHITENVAPATVIAPPDERAVDLDFDHLRKAVEDHFNATETTISVLVPMWSSRTESLLALNLDVSFALE